MNLSDKVYLNLLNIRGLSNWYNHYKSLSEAVNVSGGEPTGEEIAKAFKLEYDKIIELNKNLKDKNSLLKSELYDLNKSYTSDLNRMVSSLYDEVQELENKLEEAEKTIKEQMKLLKLKK